MGRCPVMLVSGYSDLRGSWHPYVFCSERSRDPHPRQLCDYHHDLAFAAGRRFARLGRIYASRFTRLSMEGPGGSALTEAFGAGVIAEIAS